MWTITRKAGFWPCSRSHLEPEDAPGQAAGSFQPGYGGQEIQPHLLLEDARAFPQFVSAAHGSVFWQSMTLGMVQITTSFSVNLLITLFAAHIARWFQGNPHWLRAQKWVMGTVLAGLAVRLALEQRR